MRRIVFILSLVAFVGWVPKLEAFPRYSENRDATNCRECHGDFRGDPYNPALSDGQNWGNDLMDLHEGMLSNDCTTCHGASFFPVLTNSSTGGTGLAAISCVGCHGRDEDITPNDGADGGPGPGRGDGLRAHHAANGVGVCATCHTADAVQVGEDIDPPYYFTPDAAHPNKPTNPCNPAGEEDYAGLAEGLDNDGDNLYDTNDPDCGGSGSCAASAEASTHGVNPVYGPSELGKYLGYFLLPVGVLIGLRIWRRKR